MSLTHLARTRWLATGALAVGALALSACSGPPAAPAQPPAAVVPVAGSAVPRLVLTPGAVQRLGIQTRPAEAASGGPAVHESIPYSAVVYDTDGSSWTYVNIAADTYLRQRITVVVITGDAALLSAGPPAGAQVVTVGAPELLGTEYNISGEE
jgi:hypothetical protein